MRNAQAMISAMLDIRYIATIKRIAILLLALPLKAMSQVNYNPIPVGAPFLAIVPDARAAALGSTGVATDADANSAYWNIAKTANYQQEEVQNFVSFNITPLIGNISTKINNYYASYIHPLNDFSAISAQITYFNMGEVILSDDFGNQTGVYNPNEYALALGYAQQFDEHFSLGMSAKFIKSDLTNVGNSFYTSNVDGAKAFAVDMGAYYHNTLPDDNEIAFGLALSNIGTKMLLENYNQQSNFLPMNLRLGTAYKLKVDDLNDFRFSLDLNKLLVPTPPIYVKDKQGNNTPIIAKGKDPNVSVLQAITQSFADAPGGFKEEMAEIQMGIGAEWNINHQFALRTGWVAQSKNKGYNRYLTAGLGYYLPKMNFNLAYQYAYNKTTNTARNGIVRVGIEVCF